MSNNQSPLGVTLNGTVSHIGELQTFDSGFQKQVLVVNAENGEYPQEIPFEFLKDNVSKLSSLSVGQQVEVRGNLRGSEYNGRHYINLVGWFVRAEGSAPQAATAPAADNGGWDDEGEDDIPF